MHNGTKYPHVISLDIHDASTYCAGINCNTGEVVIDKRILGNFKKVNSHLKKIDTPHRVTILVEAGPLGYAPSRYFTQLGYPVQTISPVSIPHSANTTKKKTDRDDAWNNLHYHISGLLRYSNIPSLDDENARDCLRMRQDVVYEITKRKEKILSFIKRQGLEFTVTKTNWTKAHYKWLRTVSLSSCARSVLDRHLDSIAMLEQQEKRLWNEVNTYLSHNDEYKKLREYYEMLVGIGPVVSATLILEVGDLRRFGHAKAVMKYSGLIPGKRQSGSKDPVLRITKEGNKHFRTAMVCMSKYYRDYRFMHSSKKLQNYPSEIQDFITRCQNRLTSRYRALRSRGKPSNKAVTAIAREMCGFLWEYVNIVLPSLSVCKLKAVA